MCAWLGWAGRRAQVSRCGITDRSARAVGRMLEDSRFLRRLDASWNRLGRRGGVVSLRGGGHRCVGGRMDG